MRAVDRDGRADEALVAAAQRGIGRRSTSCWPGICRWSTTSWGVLWTDITTWMTWSRRPRFAPWTGWVTCVIRVPGLVGGDRRAAGPGAAGAADGLRGGLR